MLRILLSACAGAVLLLAPGSAGAEEARAVIERAIKVMGAEPLKDISPAIHVKIKGKYYAMDALSITGEVWQQFPEQQKVTMRIRSSDQDFVMTLVLNGSAAWETIDDQTQATDALELKEDAYRDFVNSLLPLVRDKSITLRVAGESIVEGKAATGIAVASKGHAEIRLYFDRGTGLLVKSEQRRRQSGGKGPEILHESYFSDYREVLSPAGDEKTLKSAGIATDGGGLIAFLKKQALDDGAQARIRALIQKLGDSSFDAREKAKEDLIAQGQQAAPLLSRAAHDPDPEIASRARECLDKIGKGPADATLLLAALRLIAQRRPAGAAEALLSYLPCAANDTMVQAAQGALVAVAAQNDAANKVLVQALEGKDPARRQAAAIALGRYKSSGREQPGYMLFVPGLKQALREASYRDGKKVAEIEVLDYQLFSRLPDKEFAKP